MKLQCQHLDRISALPQDIIEKILSLMPIRDALRTSILSKKWRYCWTTMPKLVFNSSMVVASGNKEIDKYKFVNAIFHVLLLHSGPILEFSLFVVELEIVKEIDQIILHLSKRNNIKKFDFGVSEIDSYLLPSSFFSLQGLEHLHLSLCIFDSSSMNKGFSMLKSLRFFDVDIMSEKMLFKFLTSCPLLEEFTWIKEDIDIEFTECELVELFTCLPSVQHLELSKLYIEHLAAGSSMPHKLPNSAVHLRILVLNVCFLELSTVVCVISSSPNLEKIKVEMCWDHDTLCARQTSKNLLDDDQDYRGLNLDHLKEMEITKFHNHALEMEFVKLIMAKSPLLKKARIELHYAVSVDEEVKMLRGLLHMPFTRASPAASFTIERPKV